MLTAAQADRIVRDGVAAMQRGDARAARLLFQQVANTAGADIAPPWLLIAQACRLERDEAGELAALDKLLADQPRHLRGLIMKGDLLGRKGGSKYRACQNCTDGSHDSSQMEFDFFETG